MLQSGKEKPSCIKSAESGEPVFTSMDVALRQMIFKQKNGARPFV
jgi:hypothetical protein